MKVILSLDHDIGEKPEDFRKKIMQELADLFGSFPKYEVEQLTMAGVSIRLRLNVESKALDYPKGI